MLHKHTANNHLLKCTNSDSMIYLVTINYDTNHCFAIFCYAIYDGKFSGQTILDESPKPFFGTEHSPKPISDIVALPIPTQPIVRPKLEKLYINVHQTYLGLGLWT